MNENTIDRIGNCILWTYAIAAPVIVISLAVILAGKAWAVLRPLLPVLVLALAGCATVEKVEEMFVPPPEEHRYVIPMCTTDTLPDGEPLPPGYVDSAGCARRVP